ncbi:MAG TPA: hypothetical protein VLE70_01475, partial [Anaerolineae bacterium]|nr:hypothetical protein [Anaerolineae bacterium]
YVTVRARIAMASPIETGYVTVRARIAMASPIETGYATVRARVAAGHPTGNKTGFGIVNSLGIRRNVARKPKTSFSNMPKIRNQSRTRIENNKATKLKSKSRVR